MPIMAKKKPTNPGGQTKRINVGFPAKWHAVARRLAAKKQQPVLYMLIALMEREAKELGVPDLPPPPWEELESE